MKLTGDGPRNTTDTNDFFGTIPDMIEKFIYANSLKSENLLSVGIALPGMIDTERGIWLHGMRIPNVHHIKLRDMVKTRFDLLVLVEDVARAVTHLQSRIGLGKGVRDFVLLHIGMGFGSGIVINKKIYRGHHGTAGEIGHMVVDPNGYRCGCGKRGCLDTVVSIPGILRTMADRRKEVTHSPLGAPFYQSTAPLSIESILQSAQSGDRFTISFLGEIGTIIADACERMVMILNPQMIIIAGHCAILEPFLKDPIDHRLKSIVLPDLLSGFTVKFAPYSPNDESYGAALLALDDYWNSA
jgi:predicted NBD/HSP70 family sugar kinase